MATRIQLVQANTSGVASLGPKDRVGRYPKHTFNVESKPFSVTPIGIAPVLPGETFKSVFFESRVITDPIVNPIVGWKKDYFWFYVKATTILGDAVRNMFIDLDDNVPLAGNLANDQKYYTAKGGTNFLELAVKKVVDEYFRDEGDTWSTYALIHGYPAAQIREQTWLDSMVDKDLVPEQSVLDTARDSGDLERLMSAYEQLRALGLVTITYEEYLASFGIDLETTVERERSTLLHHVSDFQYPSNSVDAATGGVSSAVSWVFRGGENKQRRFFKEPGFVVGLTVTRPKIYFAGLAGNMAAHLQMAWDWLPELLINQPTSSLKKFDADTGPLGDRTTLTDAYFADMRDLFTSGDQFQNRIAFDPEMDALTNASAMNALALPKTDLVWKYPTEVMVDTLFSGASKLVREDGYFSLNIQGKQRDHSPGTTLIG
jgi:hypothetical protein